MPIYICNSTGHHLLNHGKSSKLCKHRAKLRSINAVYIFSIDFGMDVFIMDYPMTAEQRSCDVARSYNSSSSGAVDRTCEGMLYEASMKQKNKPCR